MADYSVCIHEGAHAVASSLLDVGWHVVTTRPSAKDGYLGRVFSDRRHLARILNDPDGNWLASAFAVTCLVGPAAQARWEGGSAEGMGIGQVADFGGSADLDGARAAAEVWDISMQNLLNHAIDLVHHDPAWLAIQRVADALAEKHTLIPLDVDRLIGKKARGAGNW